MSRVEGRGSRVEGRGSRVEGRGSRVEGRGSRVEVEGKKNIFSCGLYLLGQSVCFAKMCQNVCL